MCSQVNISFSKVTIVALFWSTVADSGNFMIKFPEKFTIPTQKLKDFLKISQNSLTLGYFLKHFSKA